MDSIMEAEKLYIPNPRKNNTMDPLQPLVKAIDSENIDTSLSAISGTEDNQEYNQKRIAAAENIARLVGESLWFERRQSDDYKNEQSDDWLIGADQVTDCFGYSYITSELLEQRAIDHYVAYVNGHANLVIPETHTGDIRDSYLLDPLSPQLNQVLGSAVIRSSFIANESANMGGADNPERKLLMLNSRTLASQVSDDFEVTSTKYPWLATSESVAYRNRFFHGDGDEDLPDSHERIIMSLFRPEVGRKTIKNYLALQRAIATKDSGSACASIENLHGSYPDVDARQKHHEVRAVVQQLCEDNKISQAKKVVDSYFANFDGLHDSRIPEAKADLFRRIAKATGSIALAQEAAVLYDNASQRKGAFHERLEGKKLATNQLQEQLSC